MEAELSPEERVKFIIKEGESLARFFVVEAQRQRRTKSAVFIAVASLAQIYSESDPELWDDALKAFGMNKEIFKTKESNGLILDSTGEAV